MYQDGGAGWGRGNSDEISRERFPYNGAASAYNQRQARKCMVRPDYQEFAARPQGDADPRD